MVISEGDAMSVGVVNSVFGALNRTPTTGTFLVVRAQSQSAPHLVVEQVREAVTAANSAAAPGTVQGGFTTWTPRGVAVHLFATPRVSATRRDAVRGWLTAFAGSLSAAGLSGKVGTSGTWFPDTDHLGRELTHPSAFVGYRLSRYAPWGEPFTGWQVDEETTRLLAERIEAHAESVADAQSWAALAGPSVPIADQEISAFLAATAAFVDGPKIVYLLSTDQTAYNLYSMASHGQCVTQTVDPTTDWRTQVEGQVQLLLLAPEAADVGMLKNTWTSAASWDQSTVRDLHPTVRDPLDYLMNRHLWGEYVIDAAGVNLLTGKHLQHARDLDEWTIEEVAPDRFLVSAGDLEPWFRGMAAPPEVVDKARADFGDMILSWETILANPGPYTVTSPSVAGR